MESPGGAGQITSSGTQEGLIRLRIRMEIRDKLETKRRKKEKQNKKKGGGGIGEGHEAN